MRKKKRMRYLLLSFFIHLGVLTGVGGFLITPSEMAEQPIIIPVHTVLIQEEPEPEESPKRLLPRQAKLTKEAQVARARPAVGTPSATPLEDLPGPIPEEGSFRPSLSMRQMPTPGVLPTGQEGKEVQSRRVVSSSMSPPLDLPAVSPSPPDQSPILATQEARALTQAEEGGIPDRSMTFVKTRSPLGKSRPQSEDVSDLPPIPTVQAPSFPEDREMKLAEQPDSHPDAGAMTTLRPLTALMARQTARETVFDEPPPQQTASLRPLTTRETHKGPLLGPQEAFSMLLVVDTSGSVKGLPLRGIKKSAMEFVNLLGEMDRCAVITFDDKASLVVPFISDTTRLREEIDRLQSQGRNTVLFDALGHAFTLLKKEKKQRRFVVLFSDGKDEGSQLTFQQVIKKARESHVAVFCLGYSRIERRYLRTLENISKETGGIFAEAPHFAEIVELLRTARVSRVKSES